MFEMIKKVRAIKNFRGALQRSRDNGVYLLVATTLRITTFGIMTLRITRIIILALIITN